MSNAVHAAKDDIKVLYEDDVWKVLIPLTYEASCYWAQGAEWCTASRDAGSGYYDSYSADGTLFMNVNKQNKTLSTQFHFETKQFMDYYDEEIDYPIFNNMENVTQGLKDFYSKHVGRLCFYDLNGYDKETGYYIKNENKGYMLYDKNDNPLLDKHYIYIVLADNGNLLKLCGNTEVKGSIIRDLFNFMTWDLKFISDEWFYNVGDWVDGWCNVSRSDGKNFINKNGEFLLETDAVGIKPFKNNYACVAYLDENNTRNFKWNIVDTHGNFMFKEWYYTVSIEDDGVLVSRVIGEELLNYGRLRMNVCEYNKLTFDGKVMGPWAKTPHAAREYKAN